MENQKILIYRQFSSDFTIIHIISFSFSFSFIFSSSFSSSHVLLNEVIQS